MLVLVLGRTRMHLWSMLGQLDAKPSWRYVWVVILLRGKEDWTLFRQFISVRGFHLKSENEIFQGHGRFSSEEGNTVRRVALYPTI